MVGYQNNYLAAIIACSTLHAYRWKLNCRCNISNDISLVPAMLRQANSSAVAVQRNICERHTCSHAIHQTTSTSQSQSFISHGTLSIHNNDIFVVCFTDCWIHVPQYIIMFYILKVQSRSASFQHVVCYFKLVKSLLIKIKICPKNL